MDGPGSSRIDLLQASSNHLQEFQTALTDWSLYKLLIDALTTAQELLLPFQKFIQFLTIFFMIL